MKTAICKLADYKTFVFDCDGVLLNSNKVKTEAFFNAARPYGEKAARQLAEHHVSNGGVSRYEKFRYFLESIVVEGARGPTLEELLDSYALEVRQGLSTCEIAHGLSALRDRYPDANFVVVSGGDQTELRQIFNERNLSPIFDSNIFGSPATKDEIFGRLIDKRIIQRPGVFFGDSRYDHQAAQCAGLDFIFVSGWTEVTAWRDYCDKNGIESVEALDALIAGS